MLNTFRGGHRVESLEDLRRRLTLYYLGREPFPTVAFPLGDGEAVREVIEEAKRQHYARIKHRAGLGRRRVSRPKYQS